MDNLKVILDNLVLENKLTCVKHPKHDLYIYKYTRDTAYNNDWDEYTLMCRGLVIDGSGNIIAKPFGKFFNIEEVERLNIPNLPYTITEKMDGSLLILFKYNNEVVMATCGSFTSDQAIKAKSIIDKNNPNIYKHIKDGYTYLFELIYPENRVVVDYGNESDVYLITVINNIDGSEPSYDELFKYSDLGFKVVEQHKSEDFNVLKSKNINNKEGYVIRYSDNYRVKIKFDDYIRTHTLLSGLNDKFIWETLRDGVNIFDTFVGTIVPDEVYEIIKQTISDFKVRYNDLMWVIDMEYKSVISNPNFDGSKKSFSTIVNGNEYMHELFAKHDNKPRNLDSCIWKRLKPKNSSQTILMK